MADVNAQLGEDGPGGVKEKDDSEFIDVRKNNFDVMGIEAEAEVKAPGDDAAVLRRLNLNEDCQRCESRSSTPANIRRALHDDDGKADSVDRQPEKCQSSTPSDISAAATVRVSKTWRSNSSVDESLRQVLDVSQLHEEHLANLRRTCASIADFVEHGIADVVRAAVVSAIKSVSSNGLATEAATLPSLYCVSDTLCNTPGSASQSFSVCSETEKIVGECVVDACERESFRRREERASFRRRRALKKKTTDRPDRNNYTSGYAIFETAQAEEEVPEGRLTHDSMYPDEIMAQQALADNGVDEMALKGTEHESSLFISSQTCQDTCKESGRKRRGQQQSWPLAPTSDVVDRVQRQFRSVCATRLPAKTTSSSQTRPPILRSTYLSDNSQDSGESRRLSEGGGGTPTVNMRVRYSDPPAEDHAFRKRNSDPLPGDHTNNSHDLLRGRITFGSQKSSNSLRDTSGSSCYALYRDSRPESSMPHPSSERFAHFDFCTEGSDRKMEDRPLVARGRSALEDILSDGPSLEVRSGEASEHDCRKNEYDCGKSDEIMISEHSDQRPTCQSATSEKSLASKDGVMSPASRESMKKRNSERHDWLSPLITATDKRTSILTSEELPRAESGIAQKASASTYMSSELTLMHCSSSLETKSSLVKPRATPKRPCSDDDMEIPVTKGASDSGQRSQEEVTQLPEQPVRSDSDLPLPSLLGHSLNFSDRWMSTRCQASSTSSSSSSSHSDHEMTFSDEENAGAERTTRGPANKYRNWNAQKETVAQAHKQQLLDLLRHGTKRIRCSTELVVRMELLERQLWLLDATLLSTAAVGLCHPRTRHIFGGEDITFSDRRQLVDRVYCVLFRSGICLLVIKETIAIAMISSGRDLLGFEHYVVQEKVVIPACIAALVKCSAYITALCLHFWLRRFLGQEPFLFDLLKYNLLRCGSLERWVASAQWSLPVAIVMAVIVSVLCSLSSDPFVDYFFSGHQASHVVHVVLVFIVSFFFFQVLSIFCMVFSSLRFALDAFGKVILHKNEKAVKMEDVMRAWQTLNAFVRTLAFATQMPFTILVAVPSAMLLLCAISLLIFFTEHTFFLGGASFCFVSLIVFMLFNAASVTMRCMRIPTLVNALIGPSDLSKMVVVQCMHNSDSGYRLWNELVTLSYAVKVVYVLSVLMIFVARTILEGV